MAIPKIIHQISASENISEEFETIRKTWKHLNPDWNYILWTEKNIIELIQKHGDVIQNHQYVSTLPTIKDRICAWKYYILCYYGGVYIDLDFECIEPIDELIQNRDTLLLYDRPGISSAKSKNTISSAFIGTSTEDKLMIKMCEEIQNISNYISNSVDKISYRTIDNFIFNKCVNEVFKDKYLSAIEHQLVNPFSKEEILDILKQEDYTDLVQEKFHNAYSVKYYLEQTDQNRKDFLTLLTQLPINNKVRLGNKFDGGYVVQEGNMKAIDMLLTYGVGWEISFEEDFVQKYKKPVLMFDPTMHGKYFLNRKKIWILLRHFRFGKLVEYLKKINRWKKKLKKYSEYITFVNQGILSYKTDKYDTFYNHLADFNLFGKKILLKLDIEGSEYGVLQDENIYNYLGNVTQIIIEFHDLKNRYRSFKKIVTRLLESYDILHVHGNNFSNTFCMYDYKMGDSNRDISIPDVLEMTFIQKGNITGSIATDILNQPIDYPNNPYMPEVAIEYL